MAAALKKVPGIRVVSKEDFALWYETAQKGSIDDADEMLPALKPLAHT